MTSPVTPDEPESARTERLAIAAAARLEGEVSRLRTELAACSEAFDARGDLSTAWEAAEAALPEGWYLALSPFADDRPENGGLDRTLRYHAAIRRPALRRDGRPYGGMDEVYPADGYGPTPAAALAALTARLQARSTEQGGAG